MIPHNITAILIREIAVHHDAHPTSYRDFHGQNGVVLATKEGGQVDGSGKPGQRLRYRINDVLQEFDARVFHDIPLVIGDGERYVLIYAKNLGR